jgi:hypothetical protein
MFNEPVTPMPAIRPDRISASALGAIAGTYRFGPDYYVPNASVQVRSVDGHVQAVVNGSDRFAMVPIDDTHFLLRSFWVPADFRLGPDGRAVEMQIDGFRGQRHP